MVTGIKGRLAPSFRRKFLELEDECSYNRKRLAKYYKEELDTIVANYVDREVVFNYNQYSDGRDYFIRNYPFLIIDESLIIFSKE